MPHFAFAYAFHIEFSAPVHMHTYLLRCLPRVESFQKVEALTCIVQGKEAKSWLDSFGNSVISGMDAEEHNTFSLIAEGIVHQRPYHICAMPHGMYGVASALTQCTPAMLSMLHEVMAEHEERVRQATLYTPMLFLEDGQRAFASQSQHMEGQSQSFYSHAAPSVEHSPLHRFGAMHMGQKSQQALSLACLIAHAVAQHLNYVPQSTAVDTLAGEAFALGSGVCQDYAHITIALCRMAGLPARYACGFITGEGESHAWVEVCICGVWYGIDPTHHRLIDFGYIKVAHGRDSADCPMNRGTFNGRCTQETSISVKVRSL